MKRLLATPLCALLLCAMLPGQSTSSSGVSQIGNIGNALTGKKKNAQQDPNAAN